MRRTAILVSATWMLACAGGAQDEKAACDGGDVEQCAEYARLLVEAGDSWAEAEKYSALACNGGKKQACFNLGLILEKGMGVVEADPAASRDAYRMGCDLQEADACNSYGMFLVEGFGGPPSVQAGIKIWETECSKAHPENSAQACNNLWITYADGVEVPIDLPNVKLYAQLACDLQDASSCGQLGMMYQEGIGVEPDPTQAEHYLTMSCKLGYDKACAELK